MISFHSLEDRIVKTFINTHSKQVFDRRAPFAPEKAMPLKSVARVFPSEAEIAANPRSRSAVLLRGRTHGGPVLTKSTCCCWPW